MASLQQDCPLPLHPYPQKTGKGRPQNKKEQTVGLHFGFARRLPQSYILKLLDREPQEESCSENGTIDKTCRRDHVGIEFYAVFVFSCCLYSAWMGFLKHSCVS